MLGEGKREEEVDERRGRILGRKGWEGRGKGLLNWILLNFVSNQHRHATSEGKEQGEVEE